MIGTNKQSRHIILASHSNLKFKETLPIKWGAKTSMERGPVVASVTNTKARNAIGAHSGSYTVYRALSIASGKFPPQHRPDLHNTESPVKVGPFPSWFDPTKIVSMDPWGLDPRVNFKPLLVAHYLDNGRKFNAMDKNKLCITKDLEHEQNENENNES